MWSLPWFRGKQASLTPGLFRRWQSEDQRPTLAPGLFRDSSRPAAFEETATGSCSPPPEALGAGNAGVHPAATLLAAARPLASTPREALSSPKHPDDENEKRNATDNAHKSQSDVSLPPSSLRSADDADTDPAACSCSRNCGWCINGISGSRMRSSASGASLAVHAPRDFLCSRPLASGAKVCFMCKCEVLQCFAPTILISK